MADIRDIGGEWTAKMLDAFQRYLSAYTTALQEHGLSTSYIDIFAGADYSAEDDGGLSLCAGFPDLVAPQAKALLNGTALRAFTVQPAFDAYVFIERNSGRQRTLERLKAQFSSLNIQIRRHEVNRELHRISRLNWERRRALLFVDAYAAELTWDTIVAVAQTRALDLWLLVPLGFGVKRRTARRVPLPPNWRARLSLLLGDEWFNEFTTAQRDADALVDIVARHFTKCLGDVFACVSSSPVVMRSFTGVPLYLLCFAAAAGDDDGRMSLDLANHLLHDVRE